MSIKITKKQEYVDDVAGEVEYLIVAALWGCLVLFVK